ncbi:MAG: hypothetical protein WBP81_09830 [Solirubrobacteraceae bacterium]
MSDDRVYLLHARDAIDAILEYTADGRDAFFADRRMRSFATSRSSVRR